MYNIPANTQFTGKSILFMTECHSTNDVAAELAQNSSIKEGTIVITDKQIAGKGQRGNSWESNPYDNITFSLIYKPHFLQITDYFFLNIIISLGIIKTLSDYVPHVQNLKIKWPNDIYYKDKKICGILISNSINGNQINNSIVGVGLNINQKEFNEPKAISLFQLSKKEFNKNLIFSTLCESIEYYYETLIEKRHDELTQMYLGLLYQKDVLAKYKIGNTIEEGKIVGITNTGLLTIQFHERIESFGFKEVVFL